MTYNEAIELVTMELLRARRKHQFPRDPIHAAAIVAEEAGELAQAALDYVYDGGDPKCMAAEAIQVAAMGLRFLVDLPEALDVDGEDVV